MGRSSLEQENLELKRTLRLMVSKAERNEATLQSFFALELKLLNCSRLADLLQLILVEFKTHFRLSAIQLVLFDPEHAARQLLDESLLQSTANLSFVDNQRLLRSLYPRGQLQVGPLCQELQQRAFPASNAKLLSCALLPLTHGQCLIGGLHLGSSDPDRYSEQFRYDYVAHLAAVISVCIENCISQENLRQLSMVDMLTKVKNRRSFDQELLLELSRASRGNYPLSCLFIDLDHFKKVNDTFGHLSGDQVLRTVGQLLKGSLRKTDLVARYGGEEFAVLLPNCDAGRARQIAEQLRVRVQELVFRSEKGHPFRMSTSIGFSTCAPAALLDWSLPDIGNELVHAADMAVYQSKHQGRNRVSEVAFPDQPLYGQSSA
ncbi:GGDEF domain-containing protein [Marinobacterium arenosum]|uniref:GGDEF domain-containing protein n=1 Tax=Marinobacterium arenosum TaxID=2862496 RepID=UPI001C947F66|nr:sensor domain-containing diguanylate cyclase [Marinobacterium arenosum]MBY4677991.1 DUF484 family protein [Marinobacterium arenosum]